MSEANRQKIKNQIAAGEARHRAREHSTVLDRAGEAAIEAKDRFTAFAHRHPLTTVAGAAALGILISGLFPRSPTRRLGRKAAGLAAVGAEAAMTYMHQALDSAGQASRSRSHRLENLGETIGDTARRIAREAAHMVEVAGDSARAAGHDVGERVSKRLHHRR